MKKMKTISTNDLIRNVADKNDQLPKKVTREVLQTFLAEIESQLSAAGSKVRLDKLGIIQIKDRAARMGRNPQTGEEIRIPASKKVSFRASKSLKEAVGVKRRATKAKKR